MKKEIGILALALMVTLSISAQGDKMRKKTNSPKFTTEQQATLHTKRMTLALDLTSSQQQEIHKLHIEAATHRKAMRTAFKTNKKNGVTFTDTQKYDKIIAKLDRQIAHKTTMRGVLNKEQYKQWSKMHGQKMKQHGKKYLNKRKKGRNEKQVTRERRMHHKE
ncbi:MAG: hypothetical protein JKY08_05085 [Flavobacteriaceae bacterium]|nr:hypothetical protein [Flavobacteriaceae bacterium]